MSSRSTASDRFYRWVGGWVGRAATPALWLVALAPPPVDVPLLCCLHRPASLSTLCRCAMTHSTNCPDVETSPSTPPTPPPLLCSALYSVLSSPELLRSTKAPLFLSLLFKVRVSGAVRAVVAAPRRDPPAVCCPPYCCVPVRRPAACVIGASHVTLWSWRAARLPSPVRAPPTARGAPTRNHSRPQQTPSPAPA